MIVLYQSSVVNFLTCVRSRGYIFSSIIMKLIMRQNACLDEISDDLENGSCWVKN